MKSKSQTAKSRSLTLALAALLGACDGGTSKVGEQPPAIGPTDTAPFGQGLSAQLPGGHPPVDRGSTQGVVPAPPPGSGSGSTALVWAVPEGWVEETPSSTMRKAQYKVAGETGDGECVVYYFGPDQGGDALANVRRWADQFHQPDGRASQDILETEEIQVGPVKVLLAKVTGTYSGGMAMRGGPSQSLESYMLLGAVAEGPDANWFFKLTGPEATLQANEGAFRAMIESLAPGK